MFFMFSRMFVYMDPWYEFPCCSQCVAYFLTIISGCDRLYFWYSAFFKHVLTTRCHSSNVRRTCSSVCKKCFHLQTCRISRMLVLTELTESLVHTYHCVRLRWGGAHWRKLKFLGYAKAMSMVPPSLWSGCTSAFRASEQTRRHCFLPLILFWRGKKASSPRMRWLHRQARDKMTS